MPPFVHEKDVPIAAEPGIAGPFPPREHDETAVFGKLGRKLVQHPPEFIGNLEVVALMDADIEKSLVAGELEIISGRIVAAGFF